MLDAVREDVLGVLHQRLVALGGVQRRGAQSVVDDVVHGDDDPGQLQSEVLESEDQSLLGGAQRNHRQAKVELAGVGGHEDAQKDRRR